jgi:PPOX class probable F420-dependent enzyme
MPAIPDSHRDLIDAPGIASLSTIDPGGMPQVTALWYLNDGDTVKTSLMTSRRKYKNLLAHPKATLFIIDPQNPMRTLEVRADTSIEDDPDLALFERIVRHYGHDPDTFPAPREGRVALILTPIHVVAKG